MVFVVEISMCSGWCWSHGLREPPTRPNCHRAAEDDAVEEAHLRGRGRKVRQRGARSQARRIPRRCWTACSGMSCGRQRESDEDVAV